MSIDVIVVNYRTPNDLEDFVYSYDQHSGKLTSNLWIVNVDPLEEDIRVAERLTASALNPTVYIQHDENVGYGRAVNNAAKQGKASMIAIFNADTRLEANVLDRTYFALVSNHSWGVLGPRTVDEKNRLTHGGIFGTLDHPVHRGWRSPDNPRFANNQEAVTVSGATYFVKRSVWNLLTNCPTYRSIAPDAEGAFLPTKHYYEETWCSYHAQAHDFKVMYFGEQKMIHKWHQASPVGGSADQGMKEAQAYFREACWVHGIPHD